MEENFEHQKIWSDRIKQTLTFAITEFGAYRFEGMLKSALKEIAEGKQGEEAKEALWYVYESLTTRYMMEASTERFEALMSMVTNARTFAKR